MTPEKALWIAVMERATNQMRSDIKRVARHRKRTLRDGFESEGARKAFLDMETTKHQLCSAWFEEICGFVGIHHDKVVRFIEQEEIKAGLKSPEGLKTNG